MNYLKINFLRFLKFYPKQQVSNLAYSLQSSFKNKYLSFFLYECSIAQIIFIDNQDLSTGLVGL